MFRTTNQYFIMILYDYDMIFNHPVYQWIGFREILQDSPIFRGKKRFPATVHYLNQSIECSNHDIEHI